MKKESFGLSFASQNNNSQNNIEITLKLQNVIILIKSVFDKGINHYCYNMIMIEWMF